MQEDPNILFDIRKQTPLASIVVITYNHAPYIAECLDSLLMQQTEFPFEICIGEDGSTDSTRELCRDYAERHPHCIRLIEHRRDAPDRKEYIAPGNYNFARTCAATRGTYIACCEGDDSWIDPHKLQKQVDLLEADSNLVLVHSDFDKLELETGKQTHAVCRTRNIPHNYNPDPKQFIFDLLELRYPITPCTVTVRAEALKAVYAESADLFKKLPMGDLPKWCELARHGAFHYMDESTALYRVLSESASNTQSPERRFRFINRASDLGPMLCKKYNLPTASTYANKIKNCNRYALLSGDLEEINRLRANKNFKFSPVEAMIHRISRTEATRKLAKWCFERRYRKTEAANR